MNQRCNLLGVDLHTKEQHSGCCHHTRTARVWLIAARRSRQNFKHSRAHHRGARYRLMRSPSCVQPRATQLRRWCDSTRQPWHWDHSALAQQPCEPREYDCSDARPARAPGYFARPLGRISGLNEKRPQPSRDDRYNVLCRCPVDPRSHTCLQVLASDRSTLQRAFDQLSHEAAFTSAPSQQRHGDGRLPCVA